MKASQDFEISGLTGVAESDIKAALFAIPGVTTADATVNVDGSVFVSIVADEEISESQVQAALKGLLGKNVTVHAKVRLQRIQSSKAAMKVIPPKVRGSDFTP